MYDRSKDKKHQEWAKTIKIRDHYTCQVCFKSNLWLHSHHLNSYDKFINERYSLINGTTLCSFCHARFHSLYGKGNNTKYQFIEFQEIMKLLMEIAKNKVTETFQVKEK